MVSRLIVGSRPGSLFLVAGIWLALVPAGPAAQAPGKAPAEFDVRLPADAELEVEGIKVRATGEVRLFQSPPLAFGDFYAYALKASWHGKTVTREIKILAGRRSKIDLRDVFQLAADRSFYWKEYTVGAAAGSVPGHHQLRQRRARMSPA